MAIGVLAGKRPRWRSDVSDLYALPIVRELPPQPADLPGELTW